MKKLVPSLITAATLCCCNIVFSGTLGTVNAEPNWTGFYVGGNAGYWWSQTDKVVTSASPSFVNQTFPLGATNITNALAQFATNSYFRDSSGWLGGAQVGYNYQYNPWVILGVDMDFEGLTNSNNNFTLQKTVNLADFNESYSGSLVVEHKINFLGTVRGRIGYLFHPTLLIYATGGLVYSNISLNTDWTVQESLGPLVFPAITTRNNIDKTVTGWTAGAGIEWLFKANWTAKLEYIYYDLNNLNSPVTLTQVNASTTPPMIWGSATGKTLYSVALGTIRMGINYHFL